jgi:hypothetical protein
LGIVEGGGWRKSTRFSDVVISEQMKLEITAQSKLSNVTDIDHDFHCIK